MNYNRRAKGFTLIELMVVIAIIGLLASVIMLALNNSRVKARDVRRKADLKQMATANELYFNTNNVYPGTAGWFSNPGHGGLDAAFVPTYASRVADDPLNSSNYIYMYFRKEYRGRACMTVGTNAQFGYYARLENPSTTDLATISDSFDQCVQSTYGMNYKYGN